jgi:hypothetical protein
MYPRPRVGQRVQLRNGKIAEVINVRKARDVIRLKNEVEAVLMGQRYRAIFGIHWLDVYYEADAIMESTQAIVIVKTLDVDKILKTV